MTAPDSEPENHPSGAHSEAGAQGSLTGLFSRLQQCDPTVLDTIWQRFFPRMTGLARKTLSGLPSCRVDAEDVAQSAFVSFWRALAGSADYQFGDRNDLWSLLGVITARKARKRTRHQLAQKRGGGKTLGESELSGDATGGPSSLSQAMAALSPPEFDLCCEEMLLKLDSDHRTVAILRLQGYSSQEIAARLGCSARTVQRRLDGIQTQWQKMSADE